MSDDALISDPKSKPTDKSNFPTFVPGEYSSLTGADQTRLTGFSSIT